MTSNRLEHSKTFQEFKSNLIHQIPRVPNNKETLEILKAKSLTDLLIVYLSWKLRLVEARPRTVVGHQRIWNSRAYLRMKSDVDSLLLAVETGTDLGPHLSLKAHRHGFVHKDPPESSSWEHRDFLLNTMCLHHFHLNPKLERKGHTVRTNEVLFAFVAPDLFEILGIFNHSVFEAKDGEFTQERERIWSYYDQYRRARMPQGGAYIGGFGGFGITTAGTPTVVTLMAFNHVELIERFDNSLESPKFLASLWPDGDVPSKTRLRWCYRHLTLGLLDEQSRTFISLTP